MLAGDAPAEAAAGDAPRRGIAAHDAAHVRDAGDLARKAAGNEAARVLADQTAHALLCSGWVHHALGVEIMDRARRSRAAEQTHARARSRHAQAADRVAVALQRPGEIGDGLEARPGQVDVAGKLEHAAEGIALLAAGLRKGEKCFPGIEHDGRLLPVRLLREGAGRQRRGQQEQQRERQREYASHSVSPPLSSR